MSATADSVRTVHSFVQDVDWNLLEETADATDAAIRYVRNHPWMLIAAGCALAAYGAVERIRSRRHHGLVRGLISP